MHRPPSPLCGAELTLEGTIKKLIETASFSMPLKNMRIIQPLAEASEVKVKTLTLLLSCAHSLSVLLSFNPVNRTTSIVS